MTVRLGVAGRSSKGILKLCSVGEIVLVAVRPAPLSLAAGLRKIEIGFAVVDGAITSTD